MGEISKKAPKECTIDELLVVKAIFDIVTEVNKSKNNKDLISTMLGKVADVFNADACSLWTYEGTKEEGRFRKIESHCSADQPVRDTLERFVQENYWRTEKVYKEPTEKEPRAYCSMPIVKELDGEKGRYAALGITRAKGEFSELEKDMFFKIEDALGTILMLKSKMHEASTDSLTGAKSRRKLYEMANKDEIPRQERYKRGLSALMIDVDHFKPINDTYGHAQGDVVLKELVDLLAENLSNVDNIIGRYGGEEFVVLLPETDYKAAIATAEKLRYAVEQNEFSRKKSKSKGTKLPLHITVSIGVASYASGMDAAQLIGEADHKAYLAKDTGRNRVC